MAVQSPGGGGVDTFGTFFDELNPGVLIAVSIITEYLYVPPRATWVSLSITDQQQNQTNRSIVLVQGYPSREHPLTWFGMLPIRSGMSYMLFLRGNLNPIFRLEDVKLTFKEFAELYNGQPPSPTT